ncbi:MAG: hypothetical protein HOO96_11550 [Polyangiaceae bacterium]|nr:hypothetical protein [Polyangiaceae bacterium]
MPHLKLLAIPIGAALLAGCYDRNAIDDRANARIDAVRSEQAHRFVYAACPADGSSDGSCGLILVHASTDAFRDKFREKKCASRTDADCEALYQRTLDAWIQQRYYAADWEGVARTCDANPGRCDDLRAYEIMLARSHNVRIQNELVHAENEIESTRRREQEEAAARALGSVVQVADLLSGPHPRRCRRYPGLFGPSELR